MAHSHAVIACRISALHQPRLELSHGGCSSPPPLHLRCARCPAVSASQAEHAEALASKQEESDKYKNIGLKLQKGRKEQKERADRLQAELEEAQQQISELQTASAAANAAGAGDTKELMTVRKNLISNKKKAEGLEKVGWLLCGAAGTA